MKKDDIVVVVIPLKKSCKVLESLCMVDLNSVGLTYTLSRQCYIFSVVHLEQERR